MSAAKALPRPLPTQPWRDGHHNGHRDRQLETTFGPVGLSVPRARLADRGEQGWRGALLSAYRRLSRRAEPLITQIHLAGVNTRPVRRALQCLFAGHLGKGAVRPNWRKTRQVWEASAAQGSP